MKRMLEFQLLKLERRRAMKRMLEVQLLKLERRRAMKRIATPRWAALGAIVAMVAVACGNTTTTQAPTTSSVSGAHAAVYDVSLKGICPDKIVLQTEWFPEAEHGGAYNLIGPGGTINAGKGTYTGPLKNTGVQLEIRAGGPFIGSSQPTAQMYADPNILLAFADTGNQIQTYAKLPTVGILAPLNKSPQVLMYDPGHYNFTSVSDVKKSGATVVYFDGLAAIDYFVGTGQLGTNQLDGSYDGSPARWVGSGGTILQQGYATHEPYVYQYDIKQWQKPVKYLLLYNFGWTIYNTEIVVRPATITKYHDCLSKLVPMWQQSEVDYITNPGPTNAVLEAVVKAMNTFWTLSPGLDTWADQQMLTLGIVSNGTGHTLGNYDFTRLTNFFKPFVDIERTNKVTIPSDLTPQDIATNQFINPNIGLPSP
jgi:hypothetical protein